MADFEGAMPVKSVRDNEIAIRLVDGASGTTATKLLSVLQEGDAYSTGVNDFGVPVMGKDGSGNAIIIPIPLPITDNGESITVDAENLDIRDLTQTDEITVYQGTSPWISKITDGTDDLEINTDGSINVNHKLFPLNHTKVNDYQTTATVGVNNEVLHFYTVTDTKKFEGRNLLVGARGAVKVRFGYSTDGSTMGTVKGVFFQMPADNKDHNIEMLELIGDGTKAICVGITNTDGTTSDVYSTITGLES